jgi:hypothetical protein
MARAVEADWRMKDHERHVLEARLARISLVLALGTLAALVLIDRHLHNDFSPQGIVSFEMCAYANACRAIVEAWGPAERIWAALSLGLDYLFMLLYAAVIFLGLRLAAVGLPERLAASTRLVAWSGWGAAVMDALENFALARMLVSPDAVSYAWPAAIAATVKFTILGVAITWLVAVWVYRGVVRRRGDVTGPMSGTTTGATRGRNGYPPRGLD